MQVYTIITTVDITPTGVRNKTNDEDWYLKRNQQRNHDTLLQVISLRCQPHVIGIDEYPPGLIPWPVNIEPSKLWVLSFEVDRTDVLGPNGELFLEDIKGVPIMTGLTETTPSFPQQFITSGPLKNITIYCPDTVK